MKPPGEHDVPCAILKLGEEFNEGRSGRGLVNVEQPEILGATGGRMIREKQRGFSDQVATRGGKAMRVLTLLGVVFAVALSAVAALSAPV